MSRDTEPARSDGHCSCGRDPDKPHDCDEPALPPHPGPPIEVVPGVHSSVCLNCGGWLETMPL